MGEQTPRNVHQNATTRIDISNAVGKHRAVSNGHSLTLAAKVFDGSES